MIFWGVENENIPLCFSLFLRYSSNRLRPVSDKPPGWEGVSSPLCRILPLREVGRAGTRGVLELVNKKHITQITFEDRFFVVLEPRFLSTSLSLFAASEPLLLSEPIQT
jgi:hypothetical protein